MSRLVITDTNTVEHEYIDDEVTAILYASALAEARPGGRVGIIGVTSDDSAVNIHLTWSEADGIVVQDHLAGVPR